MKRPELKSFPATRLNKSGFQWNRAGLVLAAVVLAAGGQAAPLDIVIGPNHKPSNIHSQDGKLPSHIRRVAVLPLSADERHVNGGHARAQFQPILIEELSRTGRFEVVPVLAEDIKRWTGKEHWSADEQLPPTLLEQIRSKYGCDAILFSKLTVFKPYPPLALGWNLRLVDAETPAVWWAADEVFDAGEKAVSNSARRFHKSNFKSPAPGADSKTALQSPQRFGHYTLNALFAALPKR